MQDNKENRAEFAQIMMGLAENYSQTITQNGANMKFLALRQYELADISRAATSMMASRKYTTMPTVADFVEHLGGGSAEDMAEVEARKVLRAIENQSPYRSVVFDNPITQAVVLQTFGGWPEMCAAVGVEIDAHWFLKDFAKTWAAFKRQGQKHFGHLPGIHEIENASRGFLGNTDYPTVANCTRPVLLGNPDRARQVLEGGTKQDMLEEKPVRTLVSKLVKAIDVEAV